MGPMTLNWFKYASPATFYPVAGKLIPWFAWSAALLAAIGLYLGLVVAPTDFQQGDAYRIIFIHVPAAWMSMFLYVVMARLERTGARLQHAALGDDGAGDRADRRPDDIHRAVDRRVLGPSDLGHILGLGRADDLRADPALPVSRRDRAAPRDRRSTARRPRVRRADAHRRRQHTRSSTSRCIGGIRCIRARRSA